VFASLNISSAAKSFIAAAAVEAAVCGGLGLTRRDCAETLADKITTKDIKIKLRIVYI
jgi:hypothetical protein